MIAKLLSKLGLKSGDHSNFFVHLRNYISGDIFSKVLLFVTIPIVTRLLTPAEYGVLSIFTSIVVIFTIILGLNFRAAVTRYFYEDNNDFNVFFKNNLVFILAFNLFAMILLYLFKDFVAGFFGVSSYLFFLSIVIVGLNIPLELYLGYLQASEQSKQFSIISFFKNSAIALISVVWIYFLRDERYYGQVYAYLAISAIIFIICLYNMKEFINTKSPFSWRHVHYTLAYGLPLLPHALSGLIMVHFNRIVINQVNGAYETGLFSFAYNVAMVMNLFITASTKAWTPRFFDYLKNKQYEKINNLALLFSSITFTIALCLILFSREIVFILSDKSYSDAATVVPIIIIGYLFQFMYTIYTGYSFYTKKTINISVFTLISGLVNIGLNYLLVPRYGYIAAAYTTVISYALLFVLHFINVKIILKENVIPLSRILPSLILTLIAAFAFIFIEQHSFNVNFVVQFLMKCVVLLGMLYLLLVQVKKRLKGVS